VTTLALFAAASFGDNPLDWLAVAIGVVVFGLLTVGVVLVVRDTIRQRGNFGINLGPARCTECAAPAPGFRKPANFKQMLLGGWTCAECGSELDKYGRPVEPQAQ
jgi:hypothetical protein